MEFDVAKRTIDYLLADSRLCDSDSVIWDFIGGEPLLEIKLITRIVDYAVDKMNKLDHHWKNSFTVRMTTNGLLYKTEEVQSFIRRYRQKLSINISIDGNKDKNDANRIFPNGRGSYNDVIMNIPLWRKQFPEEGTKMTISHRDLDLVYEGLCHLVGLGIKKIDVNPVLEDVWEVGDDRILEEQLIKFADYIINADLWSELYISCFDKDFGTPTLSNHIEPCGSMVLSVDASGDFYTCLRFAQFSLRSKVARKIGNVECGVNWNLMRPFETECFSLLDAQCQKCEIATGCKFCPAENYDSSDIGTIFSKSMAICNMHKARVHAKNYYWNKLQNKYGCE